MHFDTRLDARDYLDRPITDEMMAQACTRRACGEGGPHRLRAELKLHRNPAAEHVGCPVLLPRGTEVRLYHWRVDQRKDRWAAFYTGEDGTTYGTVRETYRT